MIECVEIDPHHPRPDLVRMIARALLSGQLVACPTDTTYGIFTVFNNNKGVRRLTAMRQSVGQDDVLPENRKEKPLALLCNSIKMLSEYVVLSDQAFRLTKHLLPGPYTLILPATREIPKKLQSRRKQIGVRMPDSALVNDIIAFLGMPLFSTTAKNPDGELISNAISLSQHWAHDIELVIDGGPFMPEPSTVLSIEKGQFVVVRQGKGALPP